jgi:hypothetical protein
MWHCHAIAKVNAFSKRWSLLALPEPGLQGQKKRS